MAYKSAEDQRRYARNHYERNKAEYKRRARQHNDRARRAIKKWLVDYLREHPCIDCGEGDIVVLDFDHREPGAKVANIADFRRTGLSLASVQAEVAKCDVRCANCHRRKTHRDRLSGAPQCPGERSDSEEQFSLFCELL